MLEPHPHFQHWAIHGTSASTLMVTGVASTAGVIHNDIKPDNILLLTDQPDSAIRVADLGWPGPISTAKQLWGPPCMGPRGIWLLRWSSRAFTPPALKCIASALCSMLCSVGNNIVPLTRVRLQLQHMSTLAVMFVVSLLEGSVDGVPRSFWANILQPPLCLLTRTLC